MHTYKANHPGTFSQIQHGFFDYLLVAHPDTNVCNKIMQEKQAFFDEYGQQVAAKNSPHITIANFWAKEAMEETITRYMQRICSQQAGFSVALNNYSGLPPHTIYLRVQNPQPLKTLAQSLQVVGNYITSCNCPGARFTNNPHVSIAQQLSESIYLKALMDYGQKTFHETFVVNELALLRRMHEYDIYKPINVFRLQALQQNLLN